MSEQSLTPSSKLSTKVVIEPFGLKHDRAGFVCGNAFIDTQLQRAVLPLVELNLTRAFVAVEPNTVKVLGFYALHSHSIDVWKCPDEWESLIACHALGGIPAAYISLFATRESYHGRGIGTAMMGDALRRVKAASQAIGTFAVTLDAADQKAFDFYSSIGFHHFGQDMRMFYLIANIP